MDIKRNSLDNHASIYLTDIDIEDMCAEDKHACLHGNSCLHIKGHAYFLLLTPWRK